MRQKSVCGENIYMVGRLEGILTRNLLVERHDGILRDR